MREHKFSNIQHEELMPYVEIDELYPGVRIRKITRLTDDAQTELIRRADTIYKQVMTGESNN